MTVLQVRRSPSRTNFACVSRAATHTSYQARDLVAPKVVGNASSCEFTGAACSVSCTEEAVVGVASCGRGQAWRERHGGQSKGLLLEVGRRSRGEAVER